MVDVGGVRENLTYLTIAFVILFVIIFAVVFSGRELTSAYVPDVFLDEGWEENLLERDSGSQLLGLERWHSVTYELDDSYPASLTVTTFKTLIMLNEGQLKDKAIEVIDEALGKDILMENNTIFSGGRSLKNGHETEYILYKGNDTSKNPYEKMKIIGEVWSCGVSGTSIICIGTAQITDNEHGNSEMNNASWQKIVEDENGTIENLTGSDGLIYNVICH